MLQENDASVFSSNRATMSAFRRTSPQQTFLAINLAVNRKPNKAVLFFSGKETIQTFNRSI